MYLGVSYQAGNVSRSYQASNVSIGVSYQAGNVSYNTYTHFTTWFPVY